MCNILLDWIISSYFVVFNKMPQNKMSQARSQFIWGNSMSFSFLYCYMIWQYSIPPATCLTQSLLGNAVVADGYLKEDPRCDDHQRKLHKSFSRLLRHLREEINQPYSMSRANGLAHTYLYESHKQKIAKVRREMSERI